MLGLPCGPVAKTPCSQCRRHGFDPWSGDYPCGLAGKESTCNTGDLGSIPGLGRSPGEGKGYPLRILAWRIPWTKQSMGSQRVGHNWATFTFTFWELRSHIPYCTANQKKKKNNNKQGIVYFCLWNLEPCSCKERLHISLSHKANKMWRLALKLCMTESPRSCAF